MQSPLRCKLSGTHDTYAGTSAVTCCDKILMSMPFGAARPLIRGLASSRLVMSAWPWKAARESRFTLSFSSMSACVSRESAPVMSSPFSSRRRPAKPFLQESSVSA